MYLVEFNLCNDAVRVDDGLYFQLNFTNEETDDALGVT